MTPKRQAVVDEERDFEWEIYVLKEPSSGRVRYVGFSKNAQKRLKRHLQSALRQNLEYPICRWIRKLDFMNLIPSLEIIERGRGEWESREKFWIAYYREKELDLLNVQAGGGVVPQESRERAAEKLKTRVFTIEHRQKISESKTGVPRPDAKAVAEIGRNAAKNNRGKKMDLSVTERQRRADRCRGLGGARWANVTPEQRVEISKAASEQMKRVWAERKNAK